MAVELALEEGLGCFGFEDQEVRQVLLEVHQIINGDSELIFKEDLELNLQKRFRIRKLLRRPLCA